MVYGPGGNSPGTELNRLMDRMGFPDQMGDIWGTQLDQAVGNNMGVARNLLDAFSPLSTSQLDRMMTRGFADPGFCPRPHMGYDHHFGCHKHTYYDKEKIHTFPEPGIRGALGAKDVMIDGKKIDIGKDAKGITPQKLEAKILTDPAFRQKIEGQVGGRICLDGNADGKITIAKKMHHPCVPFHNQVNQHIGNMLGRCFNPPMLNNVLGQLSSYLQGFQAGQGVGFGQGFQAGVGVGQAIGGQPGAGQPGQAGPAGQAPGGAGGGMDPGAILRDPTLSFEQKIAQFMFAFLEKKQKEITEKMEAMDKKGGQQGGGGDKKGGGGQKGLGSLLQMGGGVVGGMFAGPMGASMGSQIGGAVGKGLEGGGAGGAQGGTKGAGGEKSESTEMMKLKTAQEELKKMFEIVDTILKSINDMISRGPIAAIRG